MPMEQYLLICDELGLQEEMQLPQDERTAGLKALQFLVGKCGEHRKKIDDVHATLYRRVSTW